MFEKKINWAKAGCSVKLIFKWLIKAFLRLYLFARPDLPFDPVKVTKVLVYGHTGLGNFILLIPALRAIKNRLPQAKFILLHGNDTGCHEIVEHGELFDDFVVVPRNLSWIKGFQVIHKLKGEKYNLIISDFHNTSLFITLLTVLSGAEYRLGHVSSPGWRSEYDFTYNLKIRMKKDEHEIDRYMRFANAIGVETKEVDKKLTIWMSDGDRGFVENFFKENKIYEDDLVIGVQVGTSPSMRWKQWNLDRYAELCDKLILNYNAKIVLLGAANEVELVKNVSLKMSCAPIVAAGKTTIRQVAAIAEKCCFVICNDSGLMHVSAAVGTPVVAIYGPTDLRRTAPYGNEHVIVRKDLPCSPCYKMQGADKVENCNDRKCLDLISVEDVLDITGEVYPKYIKTKICR